MAELEKLSIQYGQLDKQAQIALRQSNYADLIADYANGIIAAQTAIELAQACGDIHLEAIGYLRYGASLRHLSNYDEARPQFERALALAEMIDLPQLKARSLRYLGIVAWQQGDSVACQAYNQQALALYREVGDLHGEGKTLGNLGVLFSNMGDLTQAVENYSRAHIIYQQIGDRYGESVILNNLGLVTARQGRIGLGISYVEQALAICREIGDRQGEASRLSSLSKLYHQLGDDAEALVHSQQSVALNQSLGNGRSLGFALTNLGNALYGLQRLDEAIDAYEQALTLRQELGELHLTMDCYAGLARASLALEKGADALPQVEIILDYLQANSINATADPFSIYWTCYQVLQAANDSRAFAILQTAYQKLENQASQLDDDIRASFLENVVHHRLLVTEWEAISKERLADSD